MRSGVMWRLLLFVLAVGNGQVLASGAIRGLPTDGKVAIVRNSPKFLFGSCRKAASTMNVQLQTLKTQSGAIFRRKVLSDDAFACLAALGSKPLAANSILECSKKAQAAGLKMFRWDGGLCTGYTNGIPVNMVRCPGAGSVVVYSVDVEAMKSPVVTNVTLAFSQLPVIIDVSWDVTPNSCFVAAYRTRLHNEEPNFVSTKFDQITLDIETIPCTEYNLTVTPVYANHTAMGPATTVKVVVPKALELALTLAHGSSAVKASWEPKYTCNPDKAPMAGPIKSYSVTLGMQTEITNNSTFEFILGKDTQRCTDTASTLTDDYKQVTLKAFDGLDAEIGTNIIASITDNITPGHRYENMDNCIFYQKLDETPGGAGYTYDQLQTFCQKTMLSEPFDGSGGLTSYYNDITSLVSFTPSVIVAPHYMGLKRNSTTGKWMWKTNNEQPVPDADWDSGEPSAAGDCVKLNANGKLAAVSCATPMAAVCYDYLT